MKMNWSMEIVITSKESNMMALYEMCVDWWDDSTASIWNLHLHRRSDVRMSRNTLADCVTAVDSVLPPLHPSVSQKSQDSISMPFDDWACSTALQIWSPMSTVPAEHNLAVPVTPFTSRNILKPIKLFTENE